MKLWDCVPQNTTDVCHGICVSVFWNLGLLESPLFAEPILFASHHCMVCVTQELGHKLIFSVHFVCETVCLKIAKGTTDPWLENCQKNFLNNYNKLLTSKLRALIKKFCRQAVKMLLSSCQL